jgi:predicted O-linked N-acetylglucosamine transferase (SPINDLY family)
MGAEYIDYLIADKYVVPLENQKYYSEKIVYLPHSYQVNDSGRIISNRVFSKEEVGLPKEGFVFCCFNNNFKILPDVFDCWAQILKQVDNSVLWLLEDNKVAARNLRQEAVNRGIDADRIIFAERMELSDHLARHKVADLFLDTFPYNAHTTASDALWAGLPLITIQGQSFASRVASSLLENLGLSEMISRSMNEYTSKAIMLGKNPILLREIKLNLFANRASSPLFDGKLFALHLESAFEKMYRQFALNKTPEHIFID